MVQPDSDDVFVSFTTCLARVALLRPMLDSVLDQWPAERVVLTVTDTMDVPSSIERSGIRIERSPDYGAFKKHSPAYLNLGIRRYIVIDDDCIIPAGWFDNLIQWSRRLPGHVVCGAGRVWAHGAPMEWAYGKRYHSGGLSSPLRTDIYIGSGTALFDTTFFEESVYPFSDAEFGEPGHPNWIGGDDLWFSGKLRLDTGVYVVPFASEEGSLRHPDELDYAKSPDCIWLSEKARGFAGWNRALGRFAQQFRSKGHS